MIQREGNLRNIGLRRNNIIACFANRCLDTENRIRNTTEFFNKILTWKQFVIFFCVLVSFYSKIDESGTYFQFILAGRIRKEYRNNNGGRVCFTEKLKDNWSFLIWLSDTAFQLNKNVRPVVITTSSQLKG